MSTGWFAAEAANVQPGKTTVVGGDGAVGLLGVLSAKTQAIRSTRPGGHVGYVGVPHGVVLDGVELFFSHVHLRGGPASARRFLPALIEMVWDGRIDPGKVFDLTLPLAQVAGGYRAMDERRAIKALPRPGA